MLFSEKKNNMLSIACKSSAFGFAKSIFVQLCSEPIFLKNHFRHARKNWRGNNEAADLDVAAGLCKGVGSSVLGKRDCERRLFDLLLKQIFLVQKEDDACVHKPLVIGN